MKTIVFCGPTVSAAEVHEVLDDVEVMPPVSQGDVYRAVLRRPCALGIIDGYFEHVPAVWHKEILWAMSQGVHVFGAASMGALRAVELEAFGMVGVGAIFEAFRDGTLEDDDEVAVAHGAKDTGFVACSDALVNLRATLQAAVSAGIISSSSGTEFERIAKSLFYADRCWPRVLEIGAGTLPDTELRALRAWLPGSQVDQKREDAREMLQTMRDALRPPSAPKRACFVFEDTLHWEQLKRFSAQVPLTPVGDDAVVLAELHRDTAAWLRVLEAAKTLSASAELGRRMNLAPSATEVHRQVGEFCERHDLQDRQQVDGWLASNRCSREHLQALIEAYAHASAVTSTLGSSIEAHMLDHLRWSGEYPPLLERARRRGTSGALVVDASGSSATAS